MILTIITLGAVSASENITVGDELASEDVIEDSIEEASVDEVDDEIQSVSDDEVLGDLKPEDFKVTINPILNISSMESVAVSYYNPENVDGKVHIYLNNLECYNKLVSPFAGETKDVEYGDMYNVKSAGTYNISVVFVPSEGDNLTLKEGTIKLIKPITKDDFSCNIRDGELNIMNDDIVNCQAFAEATIVISVNGAERYSKDMKIQEFKEVFINDLKITKNGNYLISVKAITSNENILLNEKTVTVNVEALNTRTKQNNPTNTNKPVTKTTLTLKKVAVKRSAKKLTIKATLKVNGKAVKSKTIKFKFNKKTYKAKTDKKDIAKIKVTKKILKKLKKGKKVTYTATYGKITKKVTVKVKK